MSDTLDKLVKDMHVGDSKVETYGKYNYFENEKDMNLYMFCRHDWKWDIRETETEKHIKRIRADDE